ncbi:MAG: hypothetical protein AAF687_04505 [Pseudomonadota bacterium]
MLRTVVQPANLNDAALADLKNWLGISRSGEDALLVDLLGASLAMCEAFTNQTPLQQIVEEQVPAIAGRYCLTSRPFRSLIQAELVGPDAMRTAINQQSFEAGPDLSGTAQVTIKTDLDGQAVAVQAQVGIATDWAALPKALKQGIIRLAAHYYRDRDTENASQPPASVTALWRPWRTLRLK